MSTETQFNPNKQFNDFLLENGLSKTVYALVTPETEFAKQLSFDGDREQYLDQFREAWTGKQDQYHETFFDVWHDWSKPVIDLDRAVYPYYYPTAGASEALRHLIFQHKATSPDGTIHMFEGEYEGYKAMAEAAGLMVLEHNKDEWKDKDNIAFYVASDDLFFISQPSAIDGNVWNDFNEFVSIMPHNSLVVDITYVGAVPSVDNKFNLNAPSIKNIVFSLSKPFGCYYDRIGGVWSKSEDLGLFGNKWFKNLTSISIGTTLMEHFDVFYIPKKYQKLQAQMVQKASTIMGVSLTASDVFILATGVSDNATGLNSYLTRTDKIRVCLTPSMAEEISGMGKCNERFSSYRI